MERSVLIAPEEAMEEYEKLRGSAPYSRRNTLKILAAGIGAGALTLASPREADAQSGYGFGWNPASAWFYFGFTNRNLFFSGHFGYGFGFPFGHHAFYHPYEFNPWLFYNHSPLILPVNGAGIVGGYHGVCCPGGGYQRNEQPKDLLTVGTVDNPEGRMEKIGKGIIKKAGLKVDRVRGQAVKVHGVDKNLWPVDYVVDIDGKPAIVDFDTRDGIDRKLDFLQDAKAKYESTTGRSLTDDMDYIYFSRDEYGNDVQAFKMEASRLFFEKYYRPKVTISR